MNAPLHPFADLRGHAGQLAAILKARARPSPRLRFPGSAAAVCQAVVDGCWNGRFFAASLGHYGDLWIRDLGLCADALRRLGHVERLRQSLAFALDAYARAGRVTTVVRRNGYAQDIYGEPADATPLLLRSLVFLGDRDLVERYRGLLLAAARAFVLGYGAQPLEGFKDTVVRRGATYAVVMQDVGRQACEALGIRLPEAAAAVDPVELLAGLWRGSHFAPTTTGAAGDFSADAALLPFVLTGATTHGMLRATLDEIEKRGLDRPFPLVFSDPPGVEVPRLLPRLTVPGYQGDTIWSIFGAFTILLARRIGSPRAARYAAAYAAEIESSGTFYELFARDGTPYESLFYRSAEGMLWAAIYLDATGDLDPAGAIS